MRLHYRIIATVVLLALTACGQSSPSVVPSSTPEVSAPVEAQDLPTPTLPAVDPTAAPVAATQAPTQAPAAALRELPAFADLWTNNAQGEVLALSDQWMYRLYKENDHVYEHFAKVTAFDAQAGEIEFTLERIRVDGQDVGFDAPQNKAAYQIDDDTLSFSVLVDPADPSAGMRSTSELQRAYQPGDSVEPANLGVYEGIWTNPSGEVLFLSQNVFYHRFTDSSQSCPACLYEHYAQIDGFAAERGNLGFLLRRISVNGDDGGGFDAPFQIAHLQMDENILYYNELVYSEDPLTGIRWASAFIKAIE